MMVAAGIDGEVSAAEPEEASPRKIIHVDMDAFYASVEQRDNPQLRGKPIAVGGPRERGVVAAASYEARVFGVRSAMPSVTARRKCPQLIFVKPRFEVYRSVSQQIREIFQNYTPLIEPLSLDEAYLDVTEAIGDMGTATGIAEAIRADIRRETGLTASAGVSYNKFLAKLASDYRKPDGLYVITPRMGPGFVENLEVGKFHGIGPATATKLNRLGIMTGADLRERDLGFLTRHFGKSGHFFYWIARGVDERRVRPDRVRKSIGSETTFFTDLHDFEESWTALTPILDKLWRQVESNGVKARTVTLKVKYADFQQITRSRSQAHPVGDHATLEQMARELLIPIFPTEKGIRLLGLSLSSLGEDEEDGDQDEAEQLPLF